MTKSLARRVGRDGVEGYSWGGGGHVLYFPTQAAQDGNENINYDMATFYDG